MHCGLAQASLTEKGVEIQPTDSEFDDFVSFVCKKCNVMLSHLRSIQRSTEKKEHCFQKMASDAEKRQVDNLLELLSKTVSTSPSPSPEYCEDDSQEVRNFPFVGELVHNSDAETSDASEQVEAPEPVEAEEAPPYYKFTVTLNARRILPEKTHGIRWSWHDTHFPRKTKGVRERLVPGHINLQSN